MGTRLGLTPLVLVALLVGLLWLPFPQGAAEGPHRAALVVVFGEGQVEMRCVEFAEAQISGTDLLHRSGLSVVLSETPGLGAAVCAVEGVGCQFPAEDCFCQCRGAECRYWTYWRWEGGTWAYSRLGASSRLLEDGDMDAWVWGNGKTPPPSLTFGDVCGVPGAPSPAPRTPTPEPTATPTATATSIPAAGPTEATATPPAPPPPTATSVSAETSTPTATVAPSATPTALPAEESTPTAAVSAPQPTPTPPPAAGAPSSDAPAWGQYLGFAAMAAALTGVLALARRRKGR